MLKRNGVPRSLSPPSGNWLDDHHRIQVLLYLSLGDESLGPGSGWSFSSDGLIRCDEKCQVAILLPIFLVVPRPMTFCHLELAKTKCKQMLASKLRKLKFEQKCLVFFFVVSHVPKMGKTLFENPSNKII